MNEVQDILIATAFGAGVVVFGAFYSISLALARLAGMSAKRTALIALSYLSYGLTAVNVILFAYFLRLSGWWLGLILLMLVGYFFAPRFIWRLSVEIHKEDEKVDSSTL